MSDMQNNNPNQRKKPTSKGGILVPFPKPILERTDLDRLPPDLLITIDGQARTGKNTAGELLAGALGGILVDSGRFYRSLTQAALVAEVDLDDRDAVESFCAGARLDAVIRPNDRGVFEALTTVNSGLFTDATLVSVGALVPKVAQIPLVRALVNATLRRLYRGGRMVVLGRDIGMKVFPNTAYQFYFCAPAAIRELRDSGRIDGSAVARRDRDDAKQTFFPPKAAEVDTGNKSPEQVLHVMLDEIMERTPE
jgi:cytidylate kinase